MKALPVLDIAELLASPQSSTSGNISEKLRDICHHQGFCYLVGHGMEKKNRNIRDLAGQFFHLPREEREVLTIVNSPHFRGYTVLGNERTKGQVDWRDQIDFADELPARNLMQDDPAWLNLRGPNQWPQNLPQLKPVVTDWMSSMHHIGATMIGALAQGLGIGRGYFTPYFDPRGDARLKLIRYHVPAGVKQDQGFDQGVGWHHDTGFLTFIMQDEIGGLQVDIDGTIIDATPLKDALVMNLGEMLQIATGGYLRATPHRVLSPPPGKERQSIAYFFNPKLECEFAPINLPDGLAKQAKGAQNIDPNDPVFSVVGANILKTRLRAHPDVAKKYY
jgi:isopenicillin N synthase-like dioxygenase